MKTPGFYIAEKDAFGSGVVEAATAIPAFIGYTEKAVNGGKSLLNKPTRITSIGEYLQFFGGAPTYQYMLTEDIGEGQPDFTIKDKKYALKKSGQEYMFFDAMRFFFQNGGGPCYIVSVGDYNDTIENAKLMDNGIPPLVKEDEPTMIVVPEAIKLTESDCFTLQQAMVTHCGIMQSRVALLDIYNGDRARNHPEGDVIDNFRAGIGASFLDYSAAYYPWLETTIIDTSELGLKNFAQESLGVLKGLMMAEHGVSAEKAPEESSKVTQMRELFAHIPNVNDETYNGPSVAELNKTLTVLSPSFNDVLIRIKSELNLLPPSSAMAGILTMVDNTRGVWKAPANVSLSSVIKPIVNISHDQQEDLNVSLYGKSINAIRSFIGEGTLIWGARTLDGNSKDWRYLNVRRTMIMLEQSIKASSKKFVFEPNDVNTWAKMKSTIDGFLMNQWKKGALVGSSPEEAYSVSIGLGHTMTGDDILEGILRITILVAVSRPAEFIEITFQQQMQKS